MHFTINIPYRRVIFQVRVEEAANKENRMDLDQVARRQTLTRQVEKDISHSQNSYFMLRP